MAQRDQPTDGYVNYALTDVNQLNIIVFDLPKTFNWVTMYVTISPCHTSCKRVISRIVVRDVVRKEVSVREEVGYRDVTTSFG